MSQRLKHSQQTPKQAAIDIAMQMLRVATIAIDEHIHEGDLPLNNAQRSGIYSELVLIYNRLGKRYQGNWDPLE